MYESVLVYAFFTTELLTIGFNTVVALPGATISIPSCGPYPLLDEPYEPHIFVKEFLGTLDYNIHSKSSSKSSLGYGSLST